MPLRALAAAAVLLMPSGAHAAQGGIDGTSLSLLWVLPFAGLLLSIALGPLLAPRLWHRHDGKITAAWAAAFVAPAALVLGIEATVDAILHIALHDYLPFVILLTALFAVTGGLRIRGGLDGTPLSNTAGLAIGTLLASFAGTTGAAMLMVRPMLRANAWRKQRSHVFVFLIFLVANVGGSLTPLGDPPLFLGFLLGVPFFWPTVHLLQPMLVSVTLLLALFWVLDTRLARGEDMTAPTPEPFAVQGLVNLLLLALVLVAVLASGILADLGTVQVAGRALEISGLLRDLALVLIVVASIVLTPRTVHAANDFSWAPMAEVATLFAGIFVTMIPALAILRAGETGSLGWIVDLLSKPDGSPDDAACFWAAGILSSFLDNAPTYLVFFNSAGGDAAQLTTTLASTLTAISAGAVFMGANTYIGNAPNLMVRAVVEASGTRMPSFLGYMAWSGAILMPLFALLTLLLFR